MRFTFTAVALSLLVSNVAAHGVFTDIQGSGPGFGVTDVSGKELRLFNQALRFLKDQPASICGAQKLDGKKETILDFNKAKAAAVKQGIPTADADGTITMTMFQVNADGAGPYKCEVSEDATGKSFKAMDVTHDVPGTKGKSNAKNTNFKLVAKLPEGTKCTGPQGSCLFRCKSTLSQPFVGCGLIKPAGAGGAKDNKVVVAAPKAVAVNKRNAPARLEAEAIVARDDADYDDEDEEDVESEYKRSIPRHFNPRAMDSVDLGALFGVSRG